MTITTTAPHGSKRMHGASTGRTAMTAFQPRIWLRRREPISEFAARKLLATFAVLPGRDARAVFVVLRSDQAFNRGKPPADAADIRD